MASNRLKPILLKTAAALLLVAAVLLLGFCLYRRLDERGAFLPSWAKAYASDETFWHTRKETLPFHQSDGAYLYNAVDPQSGGGGNGGDRLHFVLKDKKLSVSTADDHLFWTSPQGVLVQDYLWEDIDHDGAQELILLCWRRGSFGDHRPFWVRQNDRDWGQHIFIYDYLPDTTVYPNPIHPIWMSSVVRMDMVSFSWDPAKKAIYIEEKDGRLSGWAWLSWGLELISEESDVSFLAAGDLLVHQAIYTYGLSFADGFDFLFDKPVLDVPDSSADPVMLRDLIRQADVAAIGQETPLVTDPGLYGDFPSFGTPAEVGQAVIDAGFDIAACATNHALDRGLIGIDSTLSVYTDESPVLCLGVKGSEDQAAYCPFDLIWREGISIALLNYTYGTNGHPLPENAPYAVHLLPDSSDTAALQEDLALAREAADCVILFVHWGTEYSSDPDETQQFFAQLFAEAGVDVVIGTHPHVVQPMEVLETSEGHQTLIFYSLGNFISGNQDRSQNSGALARFHIKKTGDGLAITDPELVLIDSVFSIQ